MKKWGIRIAATLGILFLILLILPFAFKGKILTKIKESTNNSVNANITFDDDISLSLIRNFPHISVGINNLKVVGIDSFAKDTLFATDKMRLTIDIKSVLGSGKPMTINKIYLNNPLINIIFLESGRANFDIAKVDSTATIDTTKSEPMNLQLQSIVVENARIGYVDHSMDFDMFLTGFNFDGTGSFKGDDFSLKNELNAETLDMSFGGMKLLSKTKLASNSTINMNFNTFRFDFGGIEATLNEFPLVLKGWLQMNDTNMDMDLDFSVPSSEFKSLLSVVPGAYTKDFDQVKSSGKMSLHAKIKGIMDDIRMPSTDISLKVDNSSFQYPGLPASVSGIHVDLNVKNTDGNPDNTTVDLKKFAMNLGGDPIDLSLFLTTPMSNPYGKAKFFAQVDLNKWTQFMPLDKGTKLVGKIASDLQFDGRYSQVKSGNADALKASGKIQINGLNFNAPDLLPLNIPSLTMTATPKTFDLNTTGLSYGKSSMNITGGLKNFLGYFLNGEVLMGNLEINSKSIDLNEWMPASETTTTEDSSSSEAPMAAPSIPKNLNLQFAANVGQLQFQDYNLQNCVAKIKVENGELTVSPVAANLWGSKFSLNEAKYSYQAGGKPLASGSFSILNFVPKEIAQNMGIAKSFAPVLKDVQGLMDLNLGGKTALGEDMSVDLNAVSANGLLNVIKGEMKLPSWLKQVAEQFKWSMNENMGIKPTKLGFAIENGKLNMKDSLTLNLPKGSTMKLRGGVALDQTINFGGRISAEGKSVPMTITGTVQNPKVNINWKAFGREMVGQYVDQAKGKALEKANAAADDVLKRAHDEAEKVMEEARKKAELIRSEGKQLANKQRAEGERLASEAEKKANEEIDALMLKATTQIEKIAAKKAGEKLKKEAAKKADAARAKNNDLATKTEQEAENRAVQVEQAAQQQVQKMIEAAQRQKETSLPK